MADSSYTLALTEVDDLLITAVLTDVNGNIVPTADNPPVWTEDSSSSIVTIVSSDTTSCTVRKVGAGKSTVTYTLTKSDTTTLTGLFDVVVVDEPVSVSFSAALVAPAAPAPAAVSTEPAPAAVA